MLKFQSTSTRSNMPPQHSFSQVPKAEIQRSVFDRSHKHLTTFDSGLLIPILVDEVLPGDTFHCSLQSICRLATPLKPVMDNIFMDTFFFFVPARLLWAQYENFMGDQADPLNPVAYVEPGVVFDSTHQYRPGEIEDYFGIPDLGTLTGGDIERVSAFPFLAYNLIWNEWFRDQNQQTPLSAVKADGTNVTFDPDDFVLKRRGKRHDYFTSCLPWPQKGPAVTLSLGGTAPVNFPSSTINALGTALESPIGTSQGDMVFDGTNNLPNVGTLRTGTPTGTGSLGDTIYLRSAFDLVGLPGVTADLSGATATNINALREAFQLQRMLERDARGGTRFTEILRSHFGVVAPDARLQRPEYLGGGSVNVSMHPVAQTAANDTPSVDNTQGNLAAFATASPRGGFSQSFTEPGVILGLCSVRADLTYQQGLNRMWSRLTRFDRYWPAFANLGEQAVLQKEIFASGVPAEDNVIFGYQERWAEYRYKPSIITGKFRSSASGTLDIWHLSQEFGAAPILGPDFIEENPPIARVVAVPSEPEFIGDFSFNYRCVRPMPVFSVPGLIDHF